MNSLDAVHDVINRKTTHDTYGGTHIDVTACQEFAHKVNAQALRQLLPRLIAYAKWGKKHMLTLKFAPKEQFRLLKYVQQAGFDFHYADKNVILAKICLQGHSEEACTYPKYKTVSVGVTGVVFNDDLTEFVAIQESMGPYQGPKAMTGTVDYEKGDTPLQAVVREIFEESGVRVNIESARYVAQGWTPDFRDRKPDNNLVFAFCVRKGEHQLKAQESEIRHVAWIRVDEFLAMNLLTKHEKPLILKKVVEIAQRAMRVNSPGAVQRAAWGSGKEVELYSGWS